MSEPGYRDPARPVDERVDDLLGRMTLDEKVAQLTGILPFGLLPESRPCYPSATQQATLPDGTYTIQRSAAGASAVNVPLMKLYALPTAPGSVTATSKSESEPLVWATKPWPVAPRSDSAATSRARARHSWRDCCGACRNSRAEVTGR